MPDAVEVAFHRAVRVLVPEGARLVVAVSGGGDSIALFHLLDRLGPGRRPELVVAHLDHALRRGAVADRRFVERLATTHRVPLVACRHDVREARRKGESLEEAARRVRRAFLLEAAAATEATLIATGHTLDDQAETILMRMARGAGPSALAAMAPSGPGPFVKPLLGIERSELRAWLRRRRIAFRNDASNASLAFDRNRVRRLVIPALAKALNPRAARHLVEAAARLREDAGFLDALARERFDALSARRGVALTLDAVVVASLPRPVGARVARIALEEAGCDPRRISARHVAGLVALWSAARDSALDLPGRIRAHRRRGLVEFRPCASPARS